MNYIFSGTLPKNTATYIEREADRKLYQLLEAGEFCYVFNSRKTGKSSLRVRVMSRLQQEGYVCVAIDLSLDEVELASSEQWYFGMLYNIACDLHLDLDLEQWWDLKPQLSPLAKLRYFIETVLLVEIPGKIIIFIDEIDSVLSLNFSTDDFFAFIRGCYNTRVDREAWERLGICLLGVATPSALIGDRQRTPFNIGHRIELTGFTITEAQPLLSGLVGKVARPQQALAEILYWTGGQPFLTQKLCYLLTKQESDSTVKIEDLVRAKIIANWEYHDEPEHLRTIRDRLQGDRQQIGKLLELYRQILNGDSASVQHDPAAILQLKLSGLVVMRQNRLEVYNPIYRAVFDLAWIESELALLRPHAEKMARWLSSGQNQDLLDRQEFERVQQWAADKSLSSQDYQFLNASLDLQLQQAKKAAEQILAKAKKQAKRQQLVGIIFSLVAAAIGGWAYRQVSLVREYKTLQARVSVGEDILLDSSLDKKAAAKQYLAENFVSSAQKFQHARQNLPQDPESLIYANNARSAEFNPLTIAVSVPIGKNNAVAQEILRGVAQAQQEVNACQLEQIDSSCGIGGRPLQVKIVDDDNEPEIARLLARQLIADKSVLGVVGHNASDVSIAAAREYQSKLVMISPSSFFADWSQIKQSPPVSDNYIFRTIVSLDRIVGAMTDRVVRELKHERPKMLICYDSEAINSRLHITAFEQFEAKIDLIQEPKCDLSVSNPQLTYDLIIERAIAKGANSLFLAPHIDRISEATEIARVNYSQPEDRRLKLFAGPSLYTAKTLGATSGQKAMIGMQLTVPWYPDIERQDRFMGQAKALWGDRLNYDLITWRTATAYDATWAIITGLQQSKNPSRQSLQAILSKRNFAFEGATGRVRFERGERVQEEEFIVEVRRVSGAKHQVDFFPLTDPLSP